MMLLKKNILLHNFNVTQNVNSTITKATLRQGWGLPSKRIQKRFNLNQKNYMIDAYNHGEETGFKINPSTLSLASKIIVRK